MTGIDLSALRAHFPAEVVGKLPKVTCQACSKGSCGDHKKAKCDGCGNYISPRHVHIEYVGHADVTGAPARSGPGVDMDAEGHRPRP